MAISQSVIAPGASYHETNIGSCTCQTVTTEATAQHLDTILVPNYTLCVAPFIRAPHIIPAIFERVEPNRHQRNTIPVMEDRMRQKTTQTMLKEPPQLQVPVCMQEQWRPNPDVLTAIEEKACHYLHITCHGRFYCLSANAPSSASGRDTQTDIIPECMSCGVPKRNARGIPKCMQESNNLNASNLFLQLKKEFTTYPIEYVQHVLMASHMNPKCSRIMLAPMQEMLMSTL